MNMGSNIKRPRDAYAHTGLPLGLFRCQDSLVYHSIGR
jgi:hypothetical protein